MRTTITEQIGKWSFVNFKVDIKTEDCLPAKLKLMRQLTNETES